MLQEESAKITCAKKIKPTDIVVDKQLTLSVKNANAMYKQHLEEKKAEKRKIGEESLDEVSRNIHIFNVGISEAEKAVNEGGEALEKLCQMKRTDKDKLLSVNAKISTNLKRKVELQSELEVLNKKNKKEVEKELEKS